VLAILLLMLPHIALWLLHKPLRRPLLLISAIVIAWSIFWAAIMLFELDLLNQETYGSDAQAYFEQARKIAQGVSSSEALPGEGYILFNAWVLKFSPTQNFIWIVLTSIELYSLTANLLFILIAQRLKTFIKLRKKHLAMFLILYCNGIILWTTLRGLKETMLILLLVLAMYAFYMIRRTRSLFLKAGLLMSAVFLALEMSEIRVGMQYTTFLVFAGSIIVYWFVRRLATPECFYRYRFFYRDMLLMAFVLGVVSAIVVYLLRSPIRSAVNYVLVYEQLSRATFGQSFESNLGPGGLLGYLLATFRFILGPGPIRAFQQIVYSNVFVASIKTGDILILLGATQWWLTLFLSFVHWLRCWKDTRPFWLSLDFILVLLLHVGTYTFVYAGSGDTRHRAVMYILAIPLQVYLYACASSKSVLYPNRTQMVRLTGIRLSQSIPSADKSNRPQWETGLA